MTIVAAAAAPSAACPPRAITRWSQGCRAGDMAACVAAAERLDGGDPGDAGLALELRERACDGGDARSCYRAGTLLRVRAVSPGARDAASDRLLMACAGGLERGCIDDRALRSGEVPWSRAVSSAKRAAAERARMLLLRKREIARRREDDRRYPGCTGGPDGRRRRDDRTVAAASAWTPSGADEPAAEVRAPAPVPASPPFSMPGPLPLPPWRPGRRRRR